MKFIFTLTFIILLSSISRAESIPFAPQPIPQPTTPRTLDEYSGISSKEEKKRLKLVAEQIKDSQNESDDTSVPIVYYGEKCSALKRASRAKNYLVKKEGIESNRIFTIYGGNDESWRIHIYLLAVKSTDIKLNTNSSEEQDCQAERKKLKRRIKRQPRRKNQ